ncbi:MAG: hypothetical protein HYV95_13735 [Opitutae bacterium]|nr:hypothetical protein [Opitutae bacterium]
MSELEQLTKLCRGLGASEAQAGAMARQMLKRAEQLAVERKISREDAMAHLLQILRHGRAGEVPPGFQPPAAPPPGSK